MKQNTVAHAAVSRRRCSHGSRRPRSAATATAKRHLRGGRIIGCGSRPRWAPLPLAPLPLAPLPLAPLPLAPAASSAAAHARGGHRCAALRCGTFPRGRGRELLHGGDVQAANGRRMRHWPGTAACGALVKGLPSRSRDELGISPPPLRPPPPARPGPLPVPLPATFESTYRTGECGLTLLLPTHPTGST